MSYEIKYRAVLPCVMGPDLLYPTRAMAEREINNARKAGLDMTGCQVTEVMVRPVMLRTSVGRAA